MRSISHQQAQIYPAYPGTRRRIARPPPAQQQHLSRRHQHENQRQPARHVVYQCLDLWQRNRFFRYSESTGTKAWENAPSANQRRRRKLGILKATKKASAAGPSPNTAAKTISRASPSIREINVIMAKQPGSTSLPRSLPACLRLPARCVISPGSHLNRHLNTAFVAPIAMVWELTNTL